MAGIGWKLQRMIDRGSLAGTIGAYLTGVAVTSAPWLLTTAVLTSLRLAAVYTTVFAISVVVLGVITLFATRQALAEQFDTRIRAESAALARRREG